MFKKINNNKGIVLLLSLIIVMVLLILISVYFSGLITEKRAADTEGYVLQALTLAEAGANHAVSELRERIRTDLKNRIISIRQASVFINYVSGTNSLGFLRDYAYAPGDTQFEIVGQEASLNIQSMAFDTAIQGTYNTNIIIEADGNPTNPSGEIFIFPYKFTIESQGQVNGIASGISRNIRFVQGSFFITVRRDTFAKFALFTSHHSTPSGSTVWFTADTAFNGPVHTNDRFSFANSPSAHFTDEVTQHQKKARFYNNGWPRLLDADSNPPDDIPIFDEGFERSYDIINLESSITQADLKTQALGGTSEPGSNGIYIPNDGANLIGGIYIRGNQGSHTDDPSIVMSTGANGPVYTITRSSTTKVITVDYTSNQTQIQTGAVTETYQGVPDGVDNEGILIYVNDDIGGLSGTVQKDSSVTVSSERDIVITNHVMYEEYTPSPLSAEGYTNLLGILSWGGDVRIGPLAPNDVNIHGVVMAPNGIFTVDNYQSGSPRGTATLLGGSITQFYGPFGTFWGTTQMSGYGRNFVYDARMLQGMTPPYFPYLSNFNAFDNGGLDSKLVWEDQGA